MVEAVDPAQAGQPDDDELKGQSLDQDDDLAGAE